MDGRLTDRRRAGPAAAAAPAGAEGDSEAGLKGHGPPGGAGARLGLGRRQALVAGLYMATAILLVTFNKAALSSYKFNFPNFITLVQLCCSCALLAALHAAGYVELQEHSRKDPMPVKAAGARRSWLIVPRRSFEACLPISVAYLFYMILGMASIRGVSLPMYTTLRKTTTAFTMAAEYVLQKRAQPRPIVASVGLMVAGALIAGSADLDFDLYGYSLVFASNVTTAVYLSTIARVKQSTGLNSFGLMYCNGLVCIPLLALGCLLQGDLRGVREFEHLADPGFLLAFLGSCTLAFVLNYAIFLNTTLNSPLTQSVCGNTKDLVVVAIGYAAFDSVAIGFLNLLGVALGLVGSGLFAYAKLKGGPAKKPR